MSKEIKPYSPMSEREKEFLHRQLKELEPEDTDLIMKYVQATIDIHTLKGERKLLKSQNKTVKK